MLVMGGGIAGDEMDVWQNGLQIFDMTEMAWTYAYNASGPPYERPNPVQQYYSTKY